MVSRSLFGGLFSLLLAQSAFAALSSFVDITGKVTDFDSHYVYLDTSSDRYRINRSAVPASLELHPGNTVTVEIGFRDFKMVPPSAPTINNNYKPPRKRTPADQAE